MRRLANKATEGLHQTFEEAHNGDWHMRTKTRVGNDELIKCWGHSTSLYKTPCCGNVKYNITCVAKHFRNVPQHVFVPFTQTRLHTHQVHVDLHSDIHKDRLTDRPANTQTNKRKGIQTYSQARINHKQTNRQTSTNTYKHIARA
jgi:hypothetical protein